MWFATAAALEQNRPCLKLCDRGGRDPGGQNAALAEVLCCGAGSVGGEPSNDLKHATYLCELRARSLLCAPARLYEVRELVRALCGNGRARAFADVFGDGEYREVFVGLFTRNHLP